MGTYESVSSDFLFARPSFLEGIARIWDLGNTLTEYNQSVTPSQADYFAIRQDWLVVGQAFRNAMEEGKPVGL